jgi:adenylate cyclase
VAAASVIWEQGVAQLPQGGSRKTPPLDIGIGIETGPVMVGSFGPARRRVHTVMGETVSVASRLEKLTAELGYPILLGPNLHAALSAQEDSIPEPENAAYKLQKLGDFLLAGMRAPRTVYALPVNIDLSRLHLISGLDPEISMMG